MSTILNPTDLDDLASVSPFRGGPGLRIVGANQEDNRINGSDFNDKIIGGGAQGGDSGDDVIDAGEGNDLIRSNSGHDNILAGPGNDTVAAGADDDTVFGGAGNDLIRGGRGNDILDGGFDNDTIRGGRGNDFIEGGGGADSLLGGRGNDTLVGGFGNDTLKGGGGRDTFVFEFFDGSVDTIQRFQSGKDTIDLSALGATPANTVYDRSTGELSVDGTVIADLGNNTRLDLTDDIEFA